MAAIIQADVSSYFDERSITYQQYHSIFAQFLENDQLNYRERVGSMLKLGQRRLVVNLRDIAYLDRDLYERVLTIPVQFIAPFQKALIQFIKDNFSDYPEVDDRFRYSIGFNGLEANDNNMTPRDLRANNITRLLCVEGIATRCSLVRAKLTESLHYCDQTDRYSRIQYHDNTSLYGAPTSAAFPKEDDQGNPLLFEYGWSLFYNTQSLGLQEMPENTPQGLLPCSVNVIMNDDLVDVCKPGDRVRITGVYRPLPSHQGTHENNGLFQSCLIALNIEKIDQKAKNTSIQQTEEEKIKLFSKRKDCLKILTQSIAPSIYGHLQIKRALLLLLLGGTERILSTGTHIRGDINVLMVGDPSTAKSQLLRFVLNLAPLAINTTGRGSSGVGLTAAIVSDKDTGERRLEAGAMVLADRGVVCIDEFDKMNDADRVAIHEVMEQQTVTISKAGVHMSLNSRCSVVAAANPVYGQYDTSLRPHVNVGLQDSLLSRFDLLFIVLDRPIPMLDRAIASRVIDNHTTRHNVSNGRKAGGGRDAKDGDVGSLDPSDATAVGEEQLNIYLNNPTANAFSQQYAQNGGYYVPNSNQQMLDEDDMLETIARISPGDIVSIDFLRKYIAYAKTITPILSERAVKYIAKKYAAIRQHSKDNRQSLPVTARLLETLIRLSTAVAKSRLGGVVTKRDAQIAHRLLFFALNAAEQITRRRGDEDVFTFTNDYNADNFDPDDEERARDESDGNDNGGGAGTNESDADDNDYGGTIGGYPNIKKKKATKALDVKTDKQKKTKTKKPYAKIQAQMSDGECETDIIKDVSDDYDESLSSDSDADTAKTINKPVTKVIKKKLAVTTMHNTINFDTNSHNFNIVEQMDDEEEELRANKKVKNVHSDTTLKSNLLRQQQLSSLALDSDAITMADGDYNGNNNDNDDNDYDDNDYDDNVNSESIDWSDDEQHDQNEHVVLSLDPTRYKQFIRVLNTCLDNDTLTRNNSCPIDIVLETINDGMVTGNEFSPSELLLILQKMQVENTCMVTSDQTNVIFF